MITKNRQANKIFGGFQQMGPTKRSKEEFQVVHVTVIFSLIKEVEMRKRKARKS